MLRRLNSKEICRSGRSPRRYTYNNGTVSILSSIALILDRFTNVQYDHVSQNVTEMCIYAEIICPNYMYWIRESATSRYWGGID